MKYETCLPCKGSGFTEVIIPEGMIWDSKLCEACNGSGQVKAQDPLYCAEHNARCLIIGGTTHVLTNQVGDPDDCVHPAHKILTDLKGNVWCHNCGRKVSDETN